MESLKQILILTFLGFSLSVISKDKVMNSDQLIQSLSSSSYQIRKIAKNKLKDLSQIDAMALMKQLDASSDPELRSNISVLEKRFKTNSKLSKEFQEIINLPFYSVPTDLKSDTVDFQIQEHKKHGIIELGSTRIVFLDTPLSDYDNGEINIVSLENGSSRSSYKSDEMNLNTYSDENGTSIFINKISLHITDKSFRIHGKLFKFDAVHKVIFVGKSKKDLITHIIK